jgi:hypothetical protein
LDKAELITKLRQIEEQAQLTLDEFPKTLTKERQRMIIALARYIRTEASIDSSFGLPESANEELELQEREFRRP